MSSNRASLLAGLRTGGVRSASMGVPQTAAPTMTTFAYQDTAPMSAALGGSFSNYMSPQTQLSAQDAQALQMQLMQMEILRLQALQQQQLQLELLRQQQHQNNNANRRSSQLYEAPASAAPTTTSFGRISRPSQAEQLKAQLGLNQRSSGDEQQVPMTAGLNGKFGTRLNPNAATFRFGGIAEEAGFSTPANTPATANFTTVISGGTALGNSNGSGVSNGSNGTTAPSKSESASSWRRGGSGNSMLGGRRTATINVTITPPPGERLSPPLPAATRTRPSPLQLDIATDNMALAIDGSDGETSDSIDDTSSSSNRSDSLPATPPTAGSNGSDHLPPLSPREEASKRLYEGLGIGRPAPVTAVAPQTAIQAYGHGATQEFIIPHTSLGTTFHATARVVSAAPVRQPRGPPSDKDELGPKNFATRIRKKAIGGLGAMLDARVGRTAIEAY